MLRLLKPWNRPFANTTLCLHPLVCRGPKRRQYFLPSPALMFILRWTLNGLFNWPRESLAHALSTSSLVGAIYTLYQFSYGLPQPLIIGHDFIEARTQTGSLRFKKRIGWEKIKSISENRRGLCVMDRGKFAARMLGFVLVPATTLECKEIRSELAQWAPIQGKS